MKEYSVYKLYYFYNKNDEGFLFNVVRFLNLHHIDVLHSPNYRFKSTSSHILVMPTALFQLTASILQCHFLSSLKYEVCKHVLLNVPIYKIHRRLNLMVFKKHVSYFGESVDSVRFHSLFVVFQFWAKKSCHHVTVTFQIPSPVKRSTQESHQMG